MRPAPGLLAGSVDGQLARYIKDARIAYLADSAPEVDRLMDTFAGRLGWRGAYKEVFSVPAPCFGGRGYTRLVVLQRGVELPE